jgi:N-acetyl-alpha-D-muramate 1-phosphate uridylyltransferase
LLKRAMLFAAGLGTRMRPLTEHTPKALIALEGMPLLEHALVRFEAAGLERVVVNTHHLADQITAYVDARRRRTQATHAPMEVLTSHEPTLLETGGLLKALPLLGEAPLFTANLDTLWIDGATPALERLRHAFDPTRMDVLMLVQPFSRTVGYGGRADFALRADGRLSRGGERAFVATGLSVVHPRTLAGRVVAPFSMREIWFDGQLPDGTLPRTYGLAHDGDWLHVGTPGELDAVGQYLTQLRIVRAGQSGSAG